MAVGKSFDELLKKPYGLVPPTCQTSTFSAFHGDPLPGRLFGGPKSVSKTKQGDPSALLGDWCKNLKFTLGRSWVILEVLERICLSKIMIFGGSEGLLGCLGSIVEASRRVWGV